MKIKELSYYDSELEWRLETIKFSQLTLLVGVSGVGKTQILKSIIALQNIAKGKSYNGVSWSIDFTVKNYLNYHWEGEFETRSIPRFAIIEEDDNDDESKKGNFRIIREKLSLDSRVIIERNNNEIRFEGNLLPKLSPFQSAINILSEEEDISPARNAFNQIIYSDNSYSVDAARVIAVSPLVRKYASLSIDEIKETRLPTQIKLALVYNYHPKLFNQIKESFIETFIQVEDIKLEPYKYEDVPEGFPIVLTEYPFVQIKEKGVNNWINQQHISSGMFRTLMHISELYLSSEGTVILIDEFENSLGINCIGVLTELLLDNRKLQFIITSHHPYIINNIGVEHWKIVTRKGGVVSSRDAIDFELGKSSHQAFMQLINLDAYREGIAVG